MSAGQAATGDGEGQGRGHRQDLSEDHQRGPGRRPTPLLVLSASDRAVLADVARFRLLSGGHVERLHFTGQSQLSNTRSAQRVLRRLVDDGYLVRLPRRVGGTPGSTAYVYGLGFRGQRLAWPGRRARTPELPGERFVLHTLAVAELAVQLVEAETGGLVSELTLEAEPGCWRRHLGAHGQAETLRPDLGVRLVQTATDLELSWFVEVDRSTETLARVRNKCLGYLAYYRSGEEQRLSGVFPRVLWSVPDSRRRQNVAAVLRALPAPGPELFVVAEAEASAGAVCGGVP